MRKARYPKRAYADLDYGLSGADMAPDSNEVLLRGTFTLHPNKKHTYTVTVDQTQIKCIPTQTGSSAKAITLNFDDIIGCDCMKGNTKDDTSAYVTVYAYPHKKRWARKTTLRQRETITIRISDVDSYEVNFQEASRWVNVIRCIARKIKVTSTQDLARLSLPARKRLLILVNPFSGPGTALSLFQSRVVPMLAEAGLTYHMIVTEYAGHARKMMNDLKLMEWSGVVIVSGDGLLHEVVNGLMERPDWQDAIKTPLGVLPGGSGNALVHSLLYASKEPFGDNGLKQATFMLAKQDKLLMDLVSVELASGKKLYSFLSVAWGMISDIDIESEKYRSMGGARFTLGAAIRILNLRRYQGRVSYLPYDKDEVGNTLRRTHSLYSPVDATSNAPQPVRSMSMINDVRLTTAHQSQHTAENGVNNTDVHSNEADLQKTTVDQESNSNDAETIAAVNENGSAANQESSVPSSLLPPISEPVPDDWVTVEDGFIFVLGCYLTHLGKDCIAVPSCRLDDGFIHLCTMRGTATRMQLVQALTDFQEGTIDKNTDVDRVPVKAFRLEPLTPNGTLTVDGELVEYGPIQAEILPSTATLMAPRPPHPISTDSPSGTV